MCGIFGIANYGSTSYAKATALKRATRRLLEESKIRGSRASGLCVITKDEAVLYKDGISATNLVQMPGYSKVIGHISQNKGFKTMIGHTRSPTKGSPMFNINNHPIMANRIIGVHNGIITNDDLLFRRYLGKIDRKGEVDSEIIFRLLDYHIGRGKPIVRAVQETHKVLRGSYACAFINKSNPRYLTLFCDDYSDLVLYKYAQTGVILFASTYRIAKAALRNNSILNVSEIVWKKDAKGTCIRVDTENGKVYTTDLEGGSYTGVPSIGDGCSLTPIFQGCSGHCLGCDYYGLGGATCM